MMRTTYFRNSERNGLLCDSFVRWINQLYKDLMRAGFHAYNDNGFITAICPTPGATVNSYMNMPDAWGNIQCCWSKCRQYA